MIELKNVSKKLGDFHLKNIDLTVYDDEYLVILGPTGTGKTVILEVIAGLYEPDEGTIYFNNIDVNKLAPENRKIGFVYQDYLLFPHLNVEQNILFGLRVKKKPQEVLEKKLKEIVDLLGIRHLLNRYPATLSGGEQQRVAIARSLITTPDVLLLDEPLSALDPSTKEKFQNELKLIHERTKTTTIHITHDFSEALFLADRICVMYQGQIIQIGTPNEIFNKPCNDFVAKFIGMENFFEGEIVQQNGKKGVKIGDTILNVSANLDGNVYLGIRAEDIMIYKDKPCTSLEQNCLFGKIQQIIPKGSLVKLKVDTAISLSVLITKQKFEELKCLTNDNIWVLFNNCNVHLTQDN